MRGVGDLDRYDELPADDKARQILVRDRSNRIFEDARPSKRKLREVGWRRRYARCDTACDHRNGCADRSGQDESAECSIR
jgi:hypothetical protein